MTAINPAQRLNSVNLTKIIATHTYIINGIKRTDKYTALEVIKYMTWPQVKHLYTDDLTTGAAVTALINANIF